MYNTNTMSMLKTVSEIESVPDLLSMDNSSRRRWESAVRALRDEILLHQAEAFKSQVFELAHSMLGCTVTTEEIHMMISDKSRDGQKKLSIWLNSQNNGVENIAVNESSDISEEQRRHAEFRKSVHQQEPVKQYDLSGKLIAEFPSIRKAYEMTGASVVGIALNCKGKQHSCGGFIWKYKSDNTPVEPRIVQMSKYPIVVRQYDRGHKFIREHRSIAAAAKFVGIAPCTMKSALDTNELCLGYFWKTVEHK